MARLTAALIVMLGHAQVSGLIRLPTYFLLDLAPSAVITFFVLSGLIIHATTDRTAGFRRYMIHRTARIYSVVIPAVLLSLLLAGGYAAVQGHAELSTFDREWLQWWRLPVVLTFQGEDWFAVTELPWNGPFWSLHYEVFYYALYAVLTFSAGWRRLGLTAAVCVLAGPKILLLLPCWWMGVGIARRPGFRFPTAWLAWTALLVSPVLVVGLALSHLGNWLQRHLIALEPWFAKFDHSGLFATDYMTAAFVAVGFVAARQLSFGPNSLLVRCSRPLAWTAGTTFSIYLFHRPLQHLASRYFQIGNGAVIEALAVQASIMLAILALASVTERRTAEWRRVLARFIDPATSKRSARPAESGMTRI